MEKKPIVHLRVYRGSELNYTQDGKIKNENQSVKIPHNTLEWANFLRHLKANQFVKVEVERVLDGNSLEPLKDVQNFIDEVKKAFDGDNEVVLTPDQKKIADLEAKLDALVSGKNNNRDAHWGTKLEVVPEDKSETKDELKAAREKYMEVFGKKGHHTWSVEDINAKIAEAK